MPVRRSLIAAPLLLLAALMLLLPAPRPVRADPPAETIRALAGKYKSAVVTLAVVVKTSASGYGDDSELEAPGIVIDATGLVVTTNSAIDPMSMMAAAMEDDSMGKVTTKVVSARILTADGDEIPAKVVLRDSDRNVAFLRPITAPATPMAFVDLKTAGTARIGDPLFVVSRLGRIANRSLQVQALRVTSVMERPRTLYVADTMGMMMSGNLACTEQGMPLGIVTLRVGSGGLRGGRSLFSASDSFLPVILPAEDLLELAHLAPQAKDVKDTEPTSAKPAAKPTTKPGGKPAPGKTSPKPSRTKPGKKP